MNKHSYNNISVFDAQRCLKLNDKIQLFYYFCTICFIITMYNLFKLERARSKCLLAAVFPGPVYKTLEQQVLS